MFLNDFDRCARSSHQHHSLRRNCQLCEDLLAPSRRRRRFAGHGLRHSGQITYRLGLDRQNRNHRPRHNNGQGTRSVKYSLQEIYRVALVVPQKAARMTRPKVAKSRRKCLGLSLGSLFLDASTRLYKRVCPSVGSSVRHSLFLNEPITGENGRKLLGKQSKCSKLVKSLP